MSEDDSYDGNHEGNTDFDVMYEGNEHEKYRHYRLRLIESDH